MAWRRSQARFARDEYAVSAIARPGRRRGLPGPRRCTRIASISGVKYGEPPCWPGLVSRAMGGSAGQRPGESWWSARRGTARSPPGRISCHSLKPRAVIGGPGAAGAGRMLMGPGDRGIGADRPVLALGLIAPGPQPVQDLLPGPVQGPAAMPATDRPFSSRSPPQVPPRAPRPGPEEDPVDHRPVIGPPPSPRRISRQQHPKALPFLIGQPRSWPGGTRSAAPWLMTCGRAVPIARSAAPEQCRFWA